MFSVFSKSEEETPVSLTAVITGDDRDACRQIQRILAKNGIHVSDSHVIGLDEAANRASRVVPDLTVVLVSPGSTLAISTVHDLCQAVRTHVLAVGPVGDSNIILRSLHHGADEYVDLSKLEDELTAAIVRFKARKSSHGSQSEAAGRVISVVAASGGCGASTIAVNLATTLAKKYSTCGLIDLRLPTGDLAALLDLNPAYTFADLCANIDRLDRAMFQQCFTVHKRGVHLLAAPLDPRSQRLINSKGVRKTIVMSRTGFPFVVIDAGNANFEQQLEAIWQSDTVLLVTRLDYTSVRNSRRLLNTLEELGMETSKIRLVVNRYGERRQLSIDQVEEALKLKVNHFLPDDPKLVNTSINSGTPFVIQKPSSRTSKRMEQLAFSVNGRNQDARQRQT